jgi:hypothetical protein
MTPSPELIITGQAYTVLALSTGPHGEICVTLDRAPVIDPRKQEAVVMLRQGRNREPLRLCSLPDGPRLRLRTIY